MKRRDFYLILLLSLPFGVINLLRGQSVEFDLLNYHFYIPYFALNGRLGFDIDAAHMQTYLNPLIDLPFYFFNYVWGLHASVFGFLHGWFQGLTVFVYFKIYERLLQHEKQPQSQLLHIVCILAAVLSTATPLFLDLLGTAFNDSTASLFWLISFYYLLKREESSKFLFLAGLFAGLGTGLKLTYLVSLATALLFVPIVLRFKIRPTLRIAGGVFAGFMLTGGWWAICLLAKYGNPMFPLYNNIFPNPYMNPVNFSPRDSNYILENPSDLWRMPFYLLDNRIPVIHHYVPFHDARMLTLFVAAALAALAALMLLPRARNSGLITSFPVYIGAFWLVSYFIWFKTSMVYRYFMVCDQLMPIMMFGIFVFLFSIFSGNRDSAKLRERAIVFTTAVFIGLFAFQATPQTERFAWQRHFFSVKDQAELQKYSDSMVLLPAQDNLSYIIPFFPASARFIRVQGSFENLGMKSEFYNQQIAKTVRSWQGPLYSMQLTFPDGSLNYPKEVMLNSKLVPSLGTNSLDELYARYGVKPTNDCKNIETIAHQFNDMIICRVDRIQP